jgi:hypothetical protein
MTISKNNPYLPIYNKIDELFNDYTTNSHRKPWLPMLNEFYDITKAEKMLNKSEIKHREVGALTSLQDMKEFTYELLAEWQKQKGDE